MAGFLACSSQLAAFPGIGSALLLASPSGYKEAGIYRTYSYGYSSGFSPDSLLLALYEHKELHHYSKSQKYTFLLNGALFLPDFFQLSCAKGFIRFFFILLAGR
jgi:hypothetical protein